MPSATVVLRKGKEKFQETSDGDGPVDAIYRAIDKIIRLKLVLEDYNIKSVTAGKDALGEVSVVLEYDRRRFLGRNSSTDIIEASANAYVDAINKILYIRK